MGALKKDGTGEHLSCGKATSLSGSDLFVVPYSQITTHIASKGVNRARKRTLLSATL
jgi:hypothetical protein